MSMQPKLVHRLAGHTSRVRGVSMLFALMTLVALSLAAVALVRSVDTGALILGNMSFKEDTVLASDEATRRAIAFIQTAPSLKSDILASGYRVLSLPKLDATGRNPNKDRDVVDWHMNNCKEYAAGSYATCVPPVADRIEMPNGVWARYVVTMLCTPVAANTNDCIGPTVRSEMGVDSGALRLPDNQYARSKGSAVYYRIIVRTEGTRNAVTFTEVIAHSTV